MYKLMYIHNFCLACIILISSHRTCSFPLNSNIGDVAAVINKLGGTSISIHRPVQIYSKNSGHHLRVNGTKLDGWGEDGEQKARMMLESVNINGHIRIRSINENSYICVSKRGTIKIEPKGNTIGRCVFIEDFHKGYTVFRSVYNSRWYLGIRRSGTAKAPRRTSKRQNASLFLVRVIPS